MVSVSRLQLPSVLSVGFGVSVLGWVVVRFPDAGWGAIVLMPLGTFALLTVVAGVVGFGYPRSRTPSAVLVTLWYSTLALFAPEHLLLSGPLWFAPFLAVPVVTYVALGRIGPWGPDDSSAGAVN
jgi:hypothetical protein